MDDMLSQGDDRERKPRPRRLAVIAVLAVVAAVLVVTHLPHHRPAPARPPRVAITAGPSGPVLPDGLLGKALPWAATLRLPVTGPQPTWFWPATGQMVAIGGLPRDRDGYVFTRVAGGWAVQPSSAAGPGCKICAGVPVPVYFLPERASSVLLVGTADDVAPAATSGALWLTSYRPGADTGTAAGTAQEVSDTGVPLGPQVRLPAGYQVSQGTSRGLLLTPVSQRPGMTADLLWKPGATGASRMLTGVIAVSATQVAWTPPCASRCRVAIQDLATGRVTMIRLTRGSSATSGVFSPDGRFLALQVSFGSGGDGGALAMQLEVASVKAGRLTIVPGTWASSDALTGFGWPAGSDSLVAELSFTTKVQVASWRPGAGRLAVAVIRPGEGSISLITG
jgi:hypothetical protein